jgi:hypothetical protein
MTARSLIAAVLAAALARPATAAERVPSVTCEGTLEHRSGGDHVGKCWFGETESVDTAVNIVCKHFEHCRVTGKAAVCRKDPDTRMCAEIIELYAVSR